MKYIEIEGGISSSKGFKSNGVHAGIRKNKNKLDVGLIYCEKECVAAAVYTKNKVKGAPLIVTKENLQDDKAKAIIVNSGNANTCNVDGIEKANLMCEFVAKSLKIDKKDVIVASTGVIGQNLDTDVIEKAMPELVNGLSKDGSDKFAQSIMTTDTIKKEVAIEFELDGVKCHIGAVAKGSGMINVNMATLLCFVTTDINITPEVMKYLIKDVNEDTLNMINIDGDTSTNDMLVIMSSCLAGNKEINKIDDKYFEVAGLFKEVLSTIAKLIAGDGEGATKLIECKCLQAPSILAAKAIASEVVSSNLLKAAMFAADANWGRVLCAVGNAQADFDVANMSVAFKSKAGEITVCQKGVGIPFSEDEAKQILLEKEICIIVDLNSGKNMATAWGCDLTYDYVKINAEYRT